jgi:hypothetical protein
MDWARTSSQTDWEQGVNQGPVLLPTADSGLSTGTAFISLTDLNSGLEGLKIFYPNQRIVSGSGSVNVAVVSYPFCIAMTSDTDCRVMNINMVNPYQGIVCTGNRHHIQSVYGCPLLTGISIDICYDGPTIEQVHFHPDVFIGSLDTDQTVKDFRTYVAKNLTGIQLARADWIILRDITAWMIHCGLYLCNSTYGYPIVSAEDLEFDACGVA